MSPRVIPKTPSSAEQRRQELAEANAQDRRGRDARPKAGRPTPRHRPVGAAARRARSARRRSRRDQTKQLRPALPHRDRVGAAPLEADRPGARRGTRELDRTAAAGSREHRDQDRGAARMTPPRDPWSVAAEREAARISARVEKRLRELERRPQGAAGNSASVHPSSEPIVRSAPSQGRADAGAQAWQACLRHDRERHPGGLHPRGLVHARAGRREDRLPAATRIGNPASHAQAAGGAGRSPGGSGSAVQSGSSAVGGAGHSTAAQKGEVNAGRKPSARFRSITGRERLPGLDRESLRGDGEKVP